MAHYRWRCGNCRHEVAREHRGLRPADPGPCPSCATPMLEPVVSAAAVRRLGAKIRTGGEGYQPGLARFPGDPRAYCDGPRAVSKLTDYWRRRGLRPADPHEAGPPEPAGDDNFPTFTDFLQQDGG